MAQLNESIIKTATKIAKSKKSVAMDNTIVPGGWATIESVDTDYATFTVVTTNATPQQTLILDLRELWHILAEGEKQFKDWQRLQNKKFQSIFAPDLDASKLSNEVVANMAYAIFEYVGDRIELGDEIDNAAKLCKLNPLTADCKQVLDALDDIANLQLKQEIIKVANEHLGDAYDMSTQKQYLHCSDTAKEYINAYKTMKASI